MLSTAQVDGDGRCTLHPAIQLKHQKKNGEWRVLMNACPLCVSGLPATKNTSPSPPPPPSSQQSSSSTERSSVGRSAAPDSAAVAPEDFFARRKAARNAAVNEDDGSDSRHWQQQQQQEEQLERSGGDGIDTQGGMPFSPNPERNSYGGQRSTTKRFDAQTEAKDQLERRNVFEDGEDAPSKAERKSPLPPPPPNRPHQPQRLRGHSSPPPQALRQLYASHDEVDEDEVEDNYDRCYDETEYDHDSEPNPEPNPEPVHRPDPEENNFRRGRPSAYGDRKHLPVPQPPRGSRSRFAREPRYHHPEEEEEEEMEESPPFYQPKEQDEVSQLSMSSVGRNMIKATLAAGAPSSLEGLDEEDSNDLDSEERTQVSRQMSVAGSAVSNGGVGNAPINTSEFDTKGRCVRHPLVRLRKKQFMRGWKIMLSNCPECCLDEMRRVKDERARRAKKHRKEKKKKKKSSRRKERSSKNSVDGAPPISEFNVESYKSRENRCGEGGSVGRPSSSSVNEDARSVGTASTITISSYTHSTSEAPGKWQNFPHSKHDRRAEAFQPPDEEGPELAHVTRMPYADEYGESGWYTGEVDAASGTPHGRGMMNYTNGAVYEGEFIRGRVGGHQQQNHHHHRGDQGSHSFNRNTELGTLAEGGGGGDNSRSSGWESEENENWETEEDENDVIQHPRKAASRKVVCGMIWTDLLGDSGSYTGEVSCLNIPDGVGSMRYDNGIVMEGSWKDGEMDTDSRDRGHQPTRGRGGEYRPQSSSSTFQGDLGRLGASRQGQHHIRSSDSLGSHGSIRSRGSIRSSTN